MTRATKVQIGVLLEGITMAEMNFCIEGFQSTEFQLSDDHTASIVNMYIYSRGEIRNGNSCFL